MGIIDEIQAEGVRQELREVQGLLREIRDSLRGGARFEHTRVACWPDVEDLGKHGWELMGMSQRGPGQMEFYLKRPAR